MGMYVDCGVSGMSELEQSKIHELEAGQDALDEKIKELQHELSVTNKAVAELERKVLILTGIKQHE